ncbi:MAG: hypothetical protein B7Y99_05640 [Caulobacterales bacterium 32-69-10]|nr:MAG: hypothetical protein B7Y99_05640 [Caulobacterales bacterium 32-69-10]
MRGSVGWYPAVNVAHLAGLVLLVGGIGVLDLRIAGLGRAVPIAALSRLVTPIAIAGLLVLLASGFLLLSADAGPMVRSATFQLKMALLAVGVVNALAFRRLFGDFRDGVEAPAPARVMAVASISLWLTVGALGRLIAYS